MLQTGVHCSGRTSRESKHYAVCYRARWRQTHPCWNYLQSRTGNQEMYLLAEASNGSCVKTWRRGPPALEMDAEWEQRPIVARHAINRRVRKPSPGDAYTKQRYHRDMLAAIHHSLGGAEILKRNAPEGETSPTPEYCLHHSCPRSHTRVCGSAANTNSDQGQEPHGSQTLPLSFKVSSCICLTTSWALPALFPATRKRKDTISGKVVQTLLSARKCCLEMQNTTLEGALYGLSSSPGVEWWQEGQSTHRTF